MALSNMLETISSSAGTVAAVLLASLAMHLYVQHQKLAHIPTVGGPSWPLISYIGAIRFLKHASEMYMQGSVRYRDRLFKVALMDRWLVVVTGRKLVTELAAFPEDMMSLDVATNEMIEGDYTLGPAVMKDAYHVAILKRQLNKNLAALFPAVHDEVSHAFEEYIPITDDWTAVPAMDTSMMVIARVSNRVFMGLPLCRNKRFLDLNIGFTIKVVISVITLNLLPKFLKPLIGTYLTPLPKVIRETTAMLSPEIAKRREMIQQHGRDYPDKPNDLLSWLMDDAAGHPTHDTERDMALRVLAMNFAAIHTTSNTFVHALYTLAAHPEWAQDLRKEIDTVLESEDLTKESLSQMHKLDSFIRETARVHTFVGQSLTRMAMKPITFSDGTFVPEGTIIVAGTLPQHRDEEAYPEAYAFDPWRFEQSPTEDTARKQFATTDATFLPFGHGKHACPGRIFAGQEIKAMLVHLLTKHEMRTEVEGVRPKDSFIGSMAIPDSKAKVLFRRRRV